LHNGYVFDSYYYLNFGEYAFWIFFFLYDCHYVTLFTQADTETRVHRYIGIQVHRVTESQAYRHTSRRTDTETEEIVV